MKIPQDNSMERELPTFNKSQGIAQMDKAGEFKRSERVSRTKVSRLEKKQSGEVTARRYEIETGKEGAHDGIRWRSRSLESLEQIINERSLLNSNTNRTTLLSTSQSK